MRRVEETASIKFQRIMLWQLNPKCSLHYRHWGDEWVVYDEGSGQTLTMDTLSATTLINLAEKPATLVDLASAVACDLELELAPNEDLRPRIESFMDEMKGLSLVQLGST